MPRLSSFTLQALCLAAVASASPILEDFSKISHPKIPFDPALVRSVDPSEVPEIITLDVDNLLSDFNRNFKIAQNDPFIGSLPGITLENSTLDARGVNGNDDRYQYTDRNYPFRTVGRINMSNGGWCSAFTMGPRHVISAKHCIPGSGVAASFAASQDNGDQPFGSQAITNIFSNSYPRDGTACDWQYDWAIFITGEDRIGERVGWMGIRAPQPDRMNQNVLYTLGYPQDRDGGRRPYKQDRFLGQTGYESNSAFQCDAEQYVPLVTNGDTIPGQSGSAVWDLLDGNRWVWGVISVTNDQLTVHGSGNALVQAVLDARRDFP